MEFVDSTHMCAHRPDAMADLRFQKLTARKFWRHFGDHFLIMAVKEMGGSR